VIQKNNFVSNRIIFFAYEEISWMSIAMNKSEFEYHRCKNINEVVSDSFGVNTILNHFFLLIDFDPFHEFHNDQPIRA
jgi:hypothetical protein